MPKTDCMIFFKKKQPETIKGLSAELSNFEYNKECWDQYAKTWTKKNAPVENPDVKTENKLQYVQYLGDEWGKVSDVEIIINDFIYPYITPETIAAEIGVGGGRVASKVAGKVKQLTCFDVAPEMINKAKVSLKEFTNIQFELLENPELSEKFNAHFDFIYSFDVFVHLDLQMLWKYIYEISNCLKPGGKAFIHTTNLKSPGGWKQFMDMLNYKHGGNSLIRHYFISPETIEIFAEKCNLNIIKTSKHNPENFYYNRDYLAVLEKR